MIGKRSNKFYVFFGILTLILGLGTVVGLVGFVATSVVALFSHNLGLAWNVGGFFIVFVFFLIFLVIALVVGAALDE